MTDGGLAHLTGLTELEDLNLASTAVGDAGLTHLTSLTKLTVLDLESNGGYRQRCRSPKNVDWAPGAKPRPHQGHRRRAFRA